MPEEMFYNILAERVLQKMEHDGVIERQQGQMKETCGNRSQGEE